MDGQEFFGADRLLFESDRSHAAAPWPHTQAAREELFENVPRDAVEAITHPNAEKLFSFPLTVPDIAP